MRLDHSVYDIHYLCTHHKHLLYNSILEYFDFFIVSLTTLFYGFIKDNQSDLKSIGLSTFWGKCNILFKNEQFCGKDKISVFG